MFEQGVSGSGIPADPRVAETLLPLPIPSLAPWGWGTLSYGAGSSVPRVVFT